MDGKELKITEGDFKELISSCGNDTCGKILKRIDDIGNKEALKVCVKELVYEGFRNFKHLLKAYNKGAEVTLINFKSRQGETVS